LVFVGLFMTTMAQFTCTSDCGPVCTLTGQILLEGPPDTPLNTTSALDLYTTYMPFLNNADLCNSLRFEARIWTDANGWTWVPGSQLNISGSAGDGGIYSSPILSGVGQGLCVLKHRYNAAQLIAARKLLEGHQIRIVRRMDPLHPNVTCTTTFQIDGCPFSSNPNPESAGRTWQWTQASFDDNIVNWYTESLGNMPGVEAETMVIALVNMQQEINTPQLFALPGNYLVTAFNKEFVLDPNGQADVTIQGSDIADPTGTIFYAVQGPPDANIPPQSQFLPPPLFFLNRSDIYDASNAANGVYFSRNVWDLWRTGFAFGPLNGPDQNPPTLSMAANCFSITINNTVGLKRLRILSYDATLRTSDPMSGYVVASEMPLEDGQTNVLHVCTCEDGVYVSPSCKSSCPIDCTLEGDLIIGATIKDEMMVTTCGNNAMFSHDEMTIDCNAVRYEVELFANGDYQWVTGDQLMHIKDRGQLDIYSAPFANNSQDCGIFSRFQDYQSARDILSGRDIRVIVDRRRCFVQTHIAGCPSSFFGNSFNQTIANTLAAYPVNGSCPQSFADLLATGWSLPNQIEQGIGIYYISCSDPFDPISQGNPVNMLVIQVGNGHGNAQQTTARISVQSPDIAVSYPTLFSDIAFGGSVLNHQISGTVTAVAGQDPIGLGLYPITRGGCLTVTIDSYTGLNEVSVGSAVPTASKPDIRRSFTLNSTQLSGTPVTLNLCLCPSVPFDRSMCTPLVDLKDAESENWFEKAVQSLPVQIALGTVGTLLAVASGVGLWCLIKRKSKSQAAKEYSRL